MTTVRFSRRPWATALLVILSVVGYLSLRAMPVPGQCAGNEQILGCKAAHLLWQVFPEGAFLPALPFAHLSVVHLVTNAGLLVFFLPFLESESGHAPAFGFVYVVALFSILMQILVKLVTGGVPITTGVSGGAFAAAAYVGVRHLNKLRDDDGQLGTGSFTAVALGVALIALAVVQHVLGLAPATTSTLGHLIGAVSGAATGGYVRLSSA